jgi:hypothetical protein
VNADDVIKADEKAQREATAEVLRVLHAQRAEALALLAWKSDEGEQFHLIEDPELRASFGPLIGRIARSHWWPVDQLTREFPTVIGAPGGFPGEWSVDPLKLARIISRSRLLSSRRPTRSFFCPSYPAVVERFGPSLAVSEQAVSAPS